MLAHKDAPSALVTARAGRARIPRRSMPAVQFLPQPRHTESTLCGRDIIGSVGRGAVPSSGPEVWPVANADQFGGGARGRVQPTSPARRVGPVGTPTMNRVDRLLVDEGDDVPADQFLVMVVEIPIEYAFTKQILPKVVQAQAGPEGVRVGRRPDDIMAQGDLHSQSHRSGGYCPRGGHIFEAPKRHAPERGPMRLCPAPLRPCPARF